MKRVRILFIFLLATIWFSHVTQSQSCDSLAELTCGQSNACRWVNAQCRCSSEVKLDILFAIDTSGSIGYNGFQIQKQFVSTLVTQGINNGSRIGFFMFNTLVNQSRGVIDWDPSDLVTYTDGIYWTAGWTNTPDVLAAAIAQFAATFDQERQQVLIMITDGNPCLPESLGGCPQSVCNYAAQIKLAGIRVIIIGVGDGLNTKYVNCLTQSDDDFIPVASFSTDDFNSIMGSLSGVLCPVTKQCKFTEIKSHKKTGGLNFRMNRFVEIYNEGIDFDIYDIELSGLVSATINTLPSATVPQGQYLVFYDAANILGSVGSYVGSVSAVVSCHLCPQTVCDLDPACSTDKGDETYAGYCFCDNSVYVACGNSAPTSCITANTNSIYASSTVINGCSVCTFNDADSKTSWDVTISDTGGPIDSVVYDSNTWIITDDGYSYELISKGFDNDIGDNWAQSCSQLGTPGSDPKASCTAECIDGGCGTGTCDPDSLQCDCDSVTGLYPVCLDLTGSSPSGCTKCQVIPPIDDCEVRFLKNGTKKYAVFNWTDSLRDGATQYRINYFHSTAGTATPAFTDSAIYETGNYWPNNLTYGGYVETVVVVCYGAACDITQQSSCTCDKYYSDKTLCNVITQSPTTSPTPAPTGDPTPAPTDAPTPPPTLGCPYYFWENSDVCDVERCTCEEAAKQCCLLEPDWTVMDDGQNRTHKTIEECQTDVESENEAGYLLETGPNPKAHTFTIGILVDPEDSSSDDYNCQMNIFWRLTFDDLICNYDGTTNADCNPTDPRSLARAGLSIDKTSGWLKVWGADDVLNATVTFYTEQLDCCALNVTTTPGNSCNNQNCFSSIGITGNLEIVNATPAASCRAEPCTDNRIYPMRIPVYYNYDDAFTVPPSREKELPPWLWWLIAALVVFLALMAFLVYKYWWKSKATGAALDSVQNDLDAAVTEQEDGFGAGLDGNAVGFNPLATGFNPNAAAGAVGPNAPPNGGGGGGQFIRPNVEKQVFKQEYGAQSGNLR